MVGGTQTRNVVQSEPRLERQLTVSHEAPADIDRGPKAEPAAIRGAAAADMTIRGAEIHADFVLSTAGRMRPLGKCEVGERHKCGNRYQST